MSTFIYPVQPITASGSGLATEAKQDTQITLLTDIDTNTDGIESALTTLNAKDFATQTTLATRASETTVAAIEVDTSSIDTKLTSTNALLTTIDADTSALAGTVSGSELQVDIVTSALPSGAATSALQTTGNTSLATIAGAVSGTEMQVDVLTMPSVTVTATNLDIRDLTSVSDSVSAVQSGTWNITNISGTISLPTGAATEATLASLAAEDFATQTTLATRASETTVAAIEVDTSSIDTKLTTTNSLLTTIDADTSALAGTVAGSELQVDVITMPTVTVTATNLDIRDLTSVSDSVSAVQSGTWNITNVSGTISLPTGAATEATLLTIDADTGTILTNTNRLGPVDQFDTPLLDVSSTNITASSGSPVQVVASTAAAVRKVVSVEDIGEFIGLYTGAAASEVLHIVLPLGGGEVEVNIPISTRISLRHMKNTAITTGFMSINFLG